MLLSSFPFEHPKPPIYQFAPLSQMVESKQRTQGKSGSKDDFIKRCKYSLNVSHPQGDAILILCVLNILETTLI
jgi:hypothetical protein